MDESKVRRLITIECVDNEDARKVAEDIHNQLVGNKDYIESNIMLSLDPWDLSNKVELYFFEECIDIPEITI